MAELTIIWGNTKTYNLTITDGTNPIDITGATVFFTIKKNLEDSDDDAIIKKDITSHTDPTQGKTSITLSDTDTAIEPDTYFYDIKLKRADGSIQSVPADECYVVYAVGRRTS